MKSKLEILKSKLERLQELNSINLNAYSSAQDITNAFETAFRYAAMPDETGAKVLKQKSTKKSKFDDAINDPPKKYTATPLFPNEEMRDHALKCVAALHEQSKEEAKQKRK